jgi:predicted nicotinamide N-methyase
MHDPRYKTREETVHIGSLDVRVLRVTNIDELFDELAAKDNDSIEVKDERIPYWADLWPSAIALSRYITEKNIVKKGTTVLEIGCGLGLPGAVAGMLGAEVTLTDYVTEPLDFAKYNWSLNNSHQAKFEVLDWRSMPGTIDADILLASDVAYEKRSFEHLVMLAGKVTGQGITMLLSEPGRKLAEPFINELKKEGLVKDSVLYEIPLNGLVNKVTVYRLEK